MQAPTLVSQVNYDDINKEISKLSENVSLLQKSFPALIFCMREIDKLKETQNKLKEIIIKNHEDFTKQLNEIKERIDELIKIKKPPFGMYS